MKNDPGTQLIESMQNYYRLRAPDYDVSMGYDQSNVIAKLSPVIAYMQEKLKNLTVLELGCGPCFWTQYIAQAAQSVVATDINESVLDEARKKPLNWERISLMAADAYKLPEFSQSFDAAFAVDTFCHVPLSKRKIFLDSIHSKLRSSGVILLCDQLPGEKSWTGRSDHEGNHIQTRKLPNGSEHVVIKNFPSEEEIRSIFSEYSQAVVVEKFPAARRYVIYYQIA